MAILSRKWEQQQRYNYFSCKCCRDLGPQAPTATFGFFHRGHAKPAWVVRMSIMLAGNVHPNPGPSTVRWPCPTCGQSAHYRSIQCVNRRCRQWYHIKCTNVIDVKRLDTMEVQGMQCVNWTCGDCTAAATAAQNVINCELTVHPVPEATQANPLTMPLVRVNGPCRQQRRRYRWRNFPKVADKELPRLPRSKRLKQRGRNADS